MKKTPPAHPNADTRSVDTIVDDLNQQDVLPSDSASEIAADLGTLIDPEGQSVRWDEPVGELGHRATRTPLEDETKASEVLVSKGLREAEEELRDIEEEQEEEDEQEENG